MADEEQLKIIRQGVDAWNDWRNKNPELRSELRSDLGGAHFGGADLSGADLIAAQLIATNLRGADLTGSRVYGVSVWDIKVNDQTKQQNLVITDRGEPIITVDNIKVAQFIYLLLNNNVIRKIIDTITSKAVLILSLESHASDVITSIIDYNNNQK